MLLSIACSTVQGGRSVLMLRIIDCPGISDLNCAKAGGQWLKGVKSTRVFLEEDDRAEQGLSCTVVEEMAAASLFVGYGLGIKAGA